MAISEPTQPVAGASASVAKARTSFGILGAISLSHLLNDMIQSLILAIYPLLQSEFSLTFPSCFFAAATGGGLLDGQIPDAMVAAHWDVLHAERTCFASHGRQLPYGAARRGAGWHRLFGISSGIVPRGTHGLRRSSRPGTVNFPGWRQLR